MNKLLIVTLFLFTLPAWGATWYVRPDTQGEYGLEDGTSLANAFDGNADIAWASINTGDTLYGCGDWLPADARIVIADSGSAGVHIKFSGNAVACGRSTNSTISRLGQTGAAGRAISAAGRNYVTIEDFSLSDCDQYCISWDYTATIGTVNDDTTLHVNRVDFERCGGSPGDCIWKRGYGLRVTNSTFDQCTEDCIWVNGLDVEVADNRFTGISVGSEGGDALQITLGSVTTGTYARVYDNYCDHTGVDVKYCFLFGANSMATAHEVAIYDNEAHCVENPDGTDLSCHPISVDVTTTTALRISRNWTTGGRRGINIGADEAASMTTRGIVDGNIVLRPSEIGIAVDADTDKLDVANNAVNDAGEYAISLGKSSADTKVVNNVMINSPVGFWYIVAPTATYGYNAYFGNDTDILANATPAAVGVTDMTANPKFTGGINPTTPEGFKPFATSSLCGAGYPTSAKYDYANKRLGNPPNIGAYGTCTAGRTYYSTRSTYVPR